MDRVDRLMQELASRHGNADAGFLTAVRPLVERILDPKLSEALRVPLLEMLAETFERDVQIRTDLGIARAGWARFFAQLQQRLRDLG